MDDGTILIGFSELAIALAGFTTIATIIVKVSDSTSKNLLAVRLKMVLMFSILLIVGSIAPLIISQSNLDTDQIWHWSSIAFLVSSSIVAYVAIFDMLPRTLRDPKQSWWQTLGSLVLGSASVLTALAAIFTSNPVFWYMSTLALVLGVCVIMLAGLVLSFPVFDIHRENS